MNTTKKLPDTEIGEVYIVDKDVRDAVLNGTALNVFSDQYITA